MGSKTKTTQQSNSTQTVAPPSWTMPGLQDVANQVTQAAAGLKGLPQYTGDFISTPNYNAANSAYTTAAGTAGDMGGVLDSTIHGYNPNAHYNLTGMFDAALHPLQDSLNSTLGSIRTGAADAGAYSGSRAGAILPALAMKGYDQAAADALSKISYQDYNDQQNRNLQWDSLLPDLIASRMNTATGAGDLLTQVANNNAQMSQLDINNALAKNQWQYTSPFQGLDIATSLLDQLSQNWGTTSSNGTTTTTQKSGGLGNVVAGLTGLAGAALSLPMGGGASLGGNLLGSLFKPKPAGGTGILM